MGLNDRAKLTSLVTWLKPSGNPVIVVKNG